MVTVNALRAVWRLLWTPPKTPGGVILLAGVICWVIVVALAVSGLVDWSR